MSCNHEPITEEMKAEGTYCPTCCPLDTLPEEVRDYRIRSTRIGLLTERFKRIAKRARRIGCVPPSFEVIATEDVPETKFDNVRAEWLPTGRVIRWHTIRLIGERPILAGHEFIATLEHADLDGQTVVIMRTVPGAQTPIEYREADPTNCDHCHKRIRTRKETFVVHHVETDTYKQVGRQCVADFLGGVDPKHVLTLMECLSECGEILGSYDDEDDDRESRGSRGEELYDIVHVLAQTSAVIRNIGWLPKSKAFDGQQPTAALVAGVLTSRPRVEYFTDQRGHVDYKEMEKFEVSDITERLRSNHGNQS